MQDIHQEEYAIEVNNVCKDFKVYYDKGYTLKEKLLFWKRNNHEVRHVLKNISFKVKKGEVLGLIGQNGAGKSTTLKLLSKIIYPNSGNIIMRGRVACLIELGAGFHPDMSGRENIYTNAAIFGLTKKEINERINDIISFSELEEFIDNPVRTYSSGMYMRLAFSVAINVDADILLIDEILAVGDAAFQAKCFNKLMEIKKAGTTIVIVSHSMGQIQQICDRAIWFNNNMIEQIGDAEFVCESYTKYAFNKKEKLNDSKKSINNEKNIILNDNLCWQIDSEKNCKGFDIIEIYNGSKYRWLKETSGNIYIVNNIKYAKEIVLKITYLNAIPNEKAKKFLKLKIYFCGYKIGNLVCNEGYNTILFNITDYIRQCNKEMFDVGFIINYLWVPHEYFNNNYDQRRLGIAVSSVEIISKQE